MQTAAPRSRPSRQSLRANVSASDCFSDLHPCAFTMTTAQGPKQPKPVVKPWAAAIQPQPLLLKNVAVVSVSPPTVHHSQSVLLVNGRIVSINSVIHDDQDALREGCKTVDLAGRFLCPGLIDAHVHFVAPPGEADLWST